MVKLVGPLSSLKFSFKNKCYDVFTVTQELLNNVKTISHFVCSHKFIFKLHLN